MSQKLLKIEEDPPIGSFLQARLLEFVHLAREKGFCVGISEEIDAQRIALMCGIMHPRRLRWGLRSLLSSDQDDWERFDELFDAYWKPRHLKTSSQATEGMPVSRDNSPSGNRYYSREGASLDVDSREKDDKGQNASDEGTRKGASAQENLLQTDFQFIRDKGQMRLVEALVEQLARKMRRKLIRREKIQTQGRRIDLRRTLRKSLRYGGTPLDLAFRQRNKLRPRLLLLVDVSRSMSMYSYVFLRFARGIVNAFSDAEAFAYHTKLVNITQAMRQPDFIKREHRLAMISQGWAGGTRIAESLDSFNQDYGNRLSNRSVVIIVSDGLDTDKPERILPQLEKIKKRCRKLVWLNPLLGREGYAPKTGSMMAALPFIDLFVPAHNLSSLIKLEPALINL